MRPETAPKYDMCSVKVNGGYIGVFSQSWTKEKIECVSDTYGPIDQRYWDEAIREHCNYIVSMH